MMMSDDELAVEGPIFLYGTLTDREVLVRVLCRALVSDELEPAVLENFLRVRAVGASYPLLTARPGALVRGIILRKASRGDIARLNHFEKGEYRAERHTVKLDDGSTWEAWLYSGLPHLLASEEPWELSAWQRQYKAAFLAECEAWMADCPEPD
jgi:ADP-ribose pyrophosphatase